MLLLGGIRHTGRCIEVMHVLISRHLRLASFFVVAISQDNCQNSRFINDHSFSLDSAFSRDRFRVSEPLEVSMGDFSFMVTMLLASE